MAASTRIKSELRRGVLTSLASLPLDDRLKRPVFLTGCGRSGTTILGRTLAQHPSITYLNEPRYVWSACYPQTDIWSRHSSRRQGSLYLDASHCNARQSRRLRNFFYLETLINRSPRLVEKLPINAFRLNFIHTIFSDAFFVFLLRNGVEVARSIERKCLAGQWIAGNPYKRAQLTAYAQEHDRYRDLPAQCQSFYDWGLLEWRMSVEATLDFCQALPSDKYIQVTYKDLLQDPVAILARIEQFVGLPPSQKVHSFAETTIERKSPQALPGQAPASTGPIAGHLLQRLGYWVV